MDLSKTISDEYLLDVLKKEEFIDRIEECNAEVQKIKTEMPEDPIKLEPSTSFVDSAIKCEPELNLDMDTIWSFSGTEISNEAASGVTNSTNEGNTSEHSTELEKVVDHEVSQNHGSEIIRLSSKIIFSALQINSTNNSNLNNLKRIQDEMKSLNANFSERRKKIIKPQHVCFFCYKKFGQQNFMKTLLKIDTGENVFVCGACDHKFLKNNKEEMNKKSGTVLKPLKRFEYLHNQKLKMQEHKVKRYACNVCDYKCVRKDYLNRHIVVSHGNGEKPYVCHVCNNRFGEQRNLQIHMRIHSGEKPYACTVCGYRSVHKCYVKKHMEIHTGRKPFVCNMCDYKTVRKGNLDRHLKCHSGEKPFFCSICDYKCLLKEYLDSHMRTHTREKPYVCFECGCKFWQEGKLKRHLPVHTGVKPYIL